MKDDGVGFQYGPELIEISLVPRSWVDNPDCLIDQSPENLWAWYNEIKDDPKTDTRFKIRFLERIVRRLMKRN